MLIRPKTAVIASFMANIHCVPARTKRPPCCTVKRNSCADRKSDLTGDLEQQFLRQPLIHHPAALPISAVFGMRYLHSLMRRWAVSGPGTVKCPEVGMLAVER